MTAAGSTTAAQDPLFQLNVVLWASLPQPPGSPISPVLWHKGFSLRRIEYPLDSGFSERVALKSLRSILSLDPIIDVVLYHASMDRSVLVECKAASFGTASTNARQANGFIVAAGNIANRGPDLLNASSGEVCYVVPITDAAGMATTLIALSVALRLRGLQCGYVDATGIEIRGDGVYLGVHSSASGRSILAGSLIPPQRVVTVVPGDDPRPLYIIPWMSDASSNQDLTAFREKIRAYLMAWVGSAPVGKDSSLQVRTMLNEITRGVFEYWRAKASSKYMTLQTLAIASTLLPEDGNISISRSGLQLKLVSFEARALLLEHIRSASPPPSLPEGVQLRLRER